MLAVAEGGRHARIRYRHHDVDLGMALARKLRAEGFSDVVDRAAADDGVRPREVDIFEDAGPWRLRRERLVAVGARPLEHDDFAGVDVAGIFCADHVGRAGFPGPGPAAV